MGLYSSYEARSSDEISFPTRCNTPVPPRGMEDIKPPRRYFPFIKYDSTSAEERLLNTVQNSWWEKGARIVQPHIESTNREANFALEYHNLHKVSTSQRKRDPPETATEYCLLREIFWMFQVPQTCKFFEVNGESIKIRKNVTLTSTRSVRNADFYFFYIKLFTNFSDCSLFNVRKSFSALYTHDARFAQF